MIQRLMLLALLPCALNADPAPQGRGQGAGGVSRAARTITTASQVSRIPRESRQIARRTTAPRVDRTTRTAPAGKARRLERAETAPTTSPQAKKIAQDKTSAGVKSQFDKKISSNPQLAQAKQAAIKNPEKVKRWQNDWRRFRNHHHNRFGRFNAGLFWDFLIFSPWFLFPLGYYNYWYTDYTPCWSWSYGILGRFRYPCYWDYGYAQEINLVTYVSENRWDDAIARLEDRISALEDRLADIEDEQQRLDIADQINELTWYINDIKNLQSQPTEI